MESVVIVIVNIVFIIPGHTRLFSSLLKLEHGLISGQWDVVRIDLS